MRPVTIRKPLSSLRYAVNLREYYDTLRLQAGLPARSPVPKALKFLHQPRKPAPTRTKDVAKAQSKQAAPSSQRRGENALRAAPDTDEAIAVALQRKIEQRWRDGSIVRRSFEFEDTDMETDDPELVRWWNQADELTRAFWMGWSHSLSPAKAFAAYRETTALHAKRPGTNGVGAQVPPRAG